MVSGADADLREVLDRARRLGLLGPGPVEAHIEHAVGLATAAGVTPRHFLDLGSGGGVPGLVLARLWPAATGLLLDAGQRRVEFLGEACRRLGFDSRVGTRWARAEDAARDPALRGRFDLVVARGFARPAVTAECAVGFLEVGGRLVVSEPPESDPSRWPATGLAELGFGPAEARSADEVSAVVTILEEPTGDRWPRRTGLPGKRPLWG